VSQQNQLHVFDLILLKNKLDALPGHPEGFVEVIEHAAPQPAKNGN